MESLYRMRMYFFIAGAVFFILTGLSRVIVERYEANRNYLKSELWERLAAKFLGLACIFISGGIFTFPFEGLLNAIGKAVNK